MRTYFTFGSSHPFRDKIVVINAQSLDIARKAMFEIFGTRWCGSYLENPRPEFDTLEITAIYDEFNEEISYGHP